MRSLLLMAGLGVALSACAPQPAVQVAVFGKPEQPRHVATQVVATSSVQTARYIRPDATGHFPGDYATVWNAKPAYEAAHHGGGHGTSFGMVHANGQAVAPVGKYTASGGKYDPVKTPVGKYTPSGLQAVPVTAAHATVEASAYSGAVAGRRPVGGHSAYEAHRVYRPDMDCYIISEARPEPWVGKRYACIEN